MTSKDRVLTAFSNREPDRVPIDYECNPGIDRRLKGHFRLKEDDNEGLLRALNVDLRRINPPYTGPRLHPDIPERGVKADNWGIHRKWIEHQSGGYWDYCDFPLKDLTEDQAASWPMPSPDHFDYSRARELCRQHAPYALVTGGAGHGDIINSSGMFMTMEEALVRLALDDPALLTFSRRRISILIEVTRRTLEAAGGGIDLLHIGEDLGTQIAPMVSLELYRKNIRPFHQMFVDLARSFNIPVMIHTCGSSSWAYEDFIEMGIRIVDTLQPEAVNMSPAYLKKTFGKRLCFHGCISTAGPVARGTVRETVEDCRKTLEIMMPGGGYCFSPTHQLQDNSPTENVVAMYETPLKYGRYR